MRSIFVLLFLSFAFVGFAVPGEKKLRKYQSNSLDRDRSIEVNDMLDRAQPLVETDPEKAIDLIEEALLISLKTNYQLGEAKSYLLLGEIHNQLGQFSLAFKNYNKAYPILSAEKSLVQLQELNLDMAMVLEQLENYDESIQYYQRYLKTPNFNKKPKPVSFIYNRIAQIYLKQGKLDLANSLYDQILQMEEPNGNSKELIKAKLGKGLVAEQKGELDSAIIQYSRAEGMAQRLNDIALTNKSFDYQSNLYFSNGYNIKALNSQLDKLNFNQTKGNEEDVLMSLLSVCNAYLQSEETDTALLYINEGMDLAESNGNLIYMARFKEVLSRYYNAIGNSVLALEVYREFLTLEDSISGLQLNTGSNTALSNTNNVRNRLLLLEKDRELSEKTIQVLKQEQALRDKTAKQKNLIIYFLIAGLLVVLVSSVLVFRNAKQKKVANQLLALRSLRSQMNPHFIYNALNSVNNYISKNDERAANQYLTDFSKLMRSVMEHSQHDFISLAEELSVLRLYLKLEHSRFSDQFDYELSVDEHIDLELFAIPPMLIQPYIENAIWHGLRYKEGKGHLSVVFRKNDKGISAVISDNGIGRKRSQELKTKNQKTTVSTAMRNIESRLGILNDLDMATIKVAVSDLTQESDCGTLVEIHIPKNMNA